MRLRTPKSRITQDSVQLAQVLSEVSAQAKRPGDCAAYADDMCHTGVETGESLAKRKISFSVFLVVLKVEFIHPLSEAVRGHRFPVLVRKTELKSGSWSKKACPSGRK